MKTKRRKVKKTDFNPKQSDIDKAKEEYLKNGGSITVIKPNHTERFHPYVSAQGNEPG